MDIDKRLQEAVQSFWTGRDAQADRQKEAGEVDAGIRGTVTGGQHMGALETLVVDILIAAGLTELDIKVKSKLELPGYYRAEKKWDLLVVSDSAHREALCLKALFASCAKTSPARPPQA